MAATLFELRSCPAKIWYEIYRMPQGAPSYESLLRQFRARAGLYIVGAGVSTGLAPLGKAFWTTAPLDFARNAGGFSADLPGRSIFSQRMIDRAGDLTKHDLYPDRTFRPGSWEYDLTLWKIQRMPRFHAHFHTMHHIARRRFERQVSDSYRAFNFFHPGFIATYNHDGFAADICGQVHRVLDVHGTIDRRYGSPEAAAIAASLREYDLPEPHTDILMGVPESYFCEKLARRLLEIRRFQPEFVAIIGYSFAQNGATYDDQVSLDCFLDRYRQFPGNIYVVSPEPGHLQDMLASRLKSTNVFGIAAYWNVLAGAYVRMISAPSRLASIDRVYGRMLDSYGCAMSFPMTQRKSA